MVDGGAGQLHAALAALAALGITRLPVIGLAKQFEEIYTANVPGMFRLEKNSPALHLIQRLRDEAHRFANNYHRTLRQRRIQESVLDEFPGLGEKKKLALLQRFGSIQRLRQAGVEEIASAPGIGMKLAASLQAFLAAK
jgi:excinuclease ABC subunit C